MKRLLIKLIQYYQYIASPLLGARCRFYPTCSDYVKESISCHGSFLGLCLGLKRICKCHPFHPGGVDLVPEISTKKRKVHNG
ncbi:membrane protein insertion efficiency factor YidD [Burkholderiales bacterium]|nr:membrane protein insertion efficiency factor YidD [Burkholderiales bacterium]